VPALPRDPSSSAPEDPTPTAVGTPEQLGFDLRFEAGRTLLALKDRLIEPGVTVSRALFEVPDVEYPLNVSGGPQQFKNRRLSLRAIELVLTHASLYVKDRLAAAGFVLARERSRAGGIELLVEMQGPAGPVPIRARGLFAPAGEAGIALVLHEVISFQPSPLPRAEIAQGLLDALHVPGAQPARAMVRRADPFRAVLARLLPQYGWKVPAVGDVRVQEVVLGKGELTIRAWARDLPEGWKAPREAKRGPLEDAVALAVFADSLVEGKDDASRIALVDRLVDQLGGLADVPGAADGPWLSPSVVPFAAEVLRREPRRRPEGDDLVKKALARSPEHLGVLAAHAEEEGIPLDERARRLAALGKAADAVDEPWVAARAFLTAAGLARGQRNAALALECAEAAFLADPSVPETGTLTARLLAEAGDKKRALSVGRTALERAEDPDAADAFAVELAAYARDAEGVDSARVLLRRALRRADRRDALVALIDVEVEAGALERAAELLTRLLVVVDQGSDAGGEARADVELLAARLAEARGDRDAARMHLAKARELRPSDPVVAVRLATLFDDERQIDKALEVLAGATEAADAPAAPLILAARLSVKRAAGGDAERARALLERVTGADRTPAVRRIDAEAQALLGHTGPLAEILVEDAEPTPAGVKKLLEAARLFLEVGRVDDAADAVVKAFPLDASAVADAITAAVQAPAPVGGSSGSDLVRALAVRLGELSPAALHPVAGRLAGAGRPLDAHALLGGREDRASVELRASFAEAAGDVALEVAERDRLLTLVVDEPARASQVLRRLGALHTRPGGGGPAAAADSWQRAAEVGPVEIGAWLEAALGAGDGARLAAVLRRDDADVHAVPSDPLRAAIHSLVDPADAPVRLRLSGLLAARGERLEDIEAYLTEARALPPTEAASVLAEAGVQHGRGAWLLEAAQILEQSGDVPGALARLLSASGPAAADVAVAHKAFDLAIAARDAEAIERSAQGLLARHDLPRDGRLDVHARRAHALALLDADQGRSALGAWLDEDPRADEALSLLVPDLLKRGDLEAALARLERACRSPGPATSSLAQLLARTATSAQKRGEVPVEIRARELLLGIEVGPAAIDEVLDQVLDREGARAGELERLADLYGEAGRIENAVDVLHARVAIGGADEKLAELYLRIASLEEDQLKNKAAAAEALRGRLRHAPDDASTSGHLQALLAELGDDAGLFEECSRRAGRLRAGQERSELWLRAGDCALRLERHEDARAVWLRALKSTPYSGEALDRLLALARTMKNHRLVVRARLAAAHTLAEGPAAAEQAAEAGAYLYGFMGRIRLALVAFRFAEKHDKRPARQTRIIIDLHRALGDGAAALLAVDRLLESAPERDKVFLHETRAEVLEELLHDGAAAAAARREALRLDPRQRTAARALSRHLRETGDLRAALTVDRAWADAALEGSARASAYALLAARAEEELQDPALCAELCAVALEAGPNVELLRRAVRGSVGSGAHPEAVEAIGRLLGEAISLEERLALVRQKAGIEAATLGQKGEARRTLRAALEDPALAAHAEADRVVDDLARLEEELEDPAAAAALLLDVLAEHPEGTAVLGDRAHILERVAFLLDDAKGGEAPAERSRALDLLEEAAGIAELSRTAELRRARLAEELGRPEVAVASLERLLAMSPDAEDQLALLGRLALAAERKGDLVVALGAWQGRVERAPDDVDSLRAVERLARALDRFMEARAAADALLRLGAGDEDERAARLLAAARDSRDRLGDPQAAMALLGQARAIRSDAALRQESLACAEAAGDAAEALALLDEMGALGDPLGAGPLLRRAELRLATGEELARGFADLTGALDVGLTEASAEAGAEAGRDAERRVRELLARVAAAAPELVAAALLARSGGAADGSAGGSGGGSGGGEDAPPAAFLRAALDGALLTDPRVPLELLVRLADARRRDVDLIVAAADRERDAGAGRRAADRLWDLVEALDAGAPPAQLHADDSGGIKATLSRRAAEALLFGGGLPEDVLARLSRLRPALLHRGDLRGQALMLLRDVEAWDAVASVLEDAVAAALPTERRALRLELVSVLRTGLEDEGRAVEHLQALVDEDADDREAWGELLECLDALGDKPRLAEALGRRASLAAGIERRELVRRRAAILVELGRGGEALEQLIAVRAEEPGDAELKALERRVHEERGPVELGAFLAAELRRIPEAHDAEALLALEPEAVEPHARVHAHLVLAQDDDSARGRARAILEAPARSTKTSARRS
jgi:hypothetical protein